MSPMVVLWEACGQGGGGQWSPGTCMSGTDQHVDCRPEPALYIKGLYIPPETLGQTSKYIGKVCKLSQRSVGNYK